MQKTRLFFCSSLGCHSEKVRSIVSDKILFVDDEPEVLASLKALLRKQYSIDTASSPREALEIISSSEPYAIVVSDLRMPEMVSFGPYDFHLQKGELQRDGQIVHLTTREKEMLRVLSLTPGEVVARHDLSQSGGGENTRGVDVQINRLRGKIEINPTQPVYLQTVRARGYVLHVD